MKLRLDNVVIQQGMYALNLFFTHRLNFLKNTIMYGVRGGGGGGGGGGCRHACSNGEYQRMIRIITSNVENYTCQLTVFGFK